MGLPAARLQRGICVADQDVNHSLLFSSKTERFCNNGSQAVLTCSRSSPNQEGVDI